MAFSFQGSGGGGFGSPMQGNPATAPVQAQSGPELEEVQTETLGFVSIAGDAKVRLLSTPWPSEALPPPTSSLLSVASSRGLLAAAGPGAIIIASTESVRQAFHVVQRDNIKPFQPQLTIPIQFRVSQVAFSADENALVISSENGGGLAVYSVQEFERGNTQPAFEISTNSMALRELVPNPVKERADLIAMVTVEGQLLLANLSSKQLLSGPNGPVLKERVSCVSWSKQGKQVIAGLADGKACQLNPEGVEKAEIPVAPGFPHGGQHVSSIAWLENDVFLIGYNAPADMDGMAAGVQYYLVTRQPLTTFTFQKLPEVCSPFGLDRSPPSQFVVRLRNFPPNLWDILIVASTTSSDIGLFSRSREPLASDKEQEKIVNVFTTTTTANDSLRAALPLGEGLGDTSAIGVALDLSAREKVKQPIPGEEIDEAPHPLPNYMVLNNEGILSSWWMMYTDSIRQGTVYPSLVAAGGVDQKLPGSDPSVAAADTPMQASAPTSAATTTPAFGQSAFGQSSMPSSNPLAAPKLNLSSTSGLGAGASPAFGSATGLGQNKPAWNASGFNANFGQPAFGSSSALGSGGTPAFGASSALGGSSATPAFGSSGGLGAKTSVWGSGGGAGTGGSAFGQPGGIGMGSSSTPAFGASTGNTPSASGGFGSYAKSGGFGGLSSGQPAASPFGAPAETSLGKPTMPAESSFGKPAESAFGKPTESSFGKPSESLFGKPVANTSFGSSMDISFGQSPKKPESGSPFGAGGGGFKLGSTFKADESAANEGPKPSNLGPGGFSVGGLGDALEQPTKPSATPDVREESMDEGQDDSTTAPPATQPPASNFFSNSTTPPSSQPKTTPFSSTTPLFGTQTKPDVTPAAVQESKPAPTFGVPASTTPEATPQKAGFTPTSAPPSPKIKTEPPSDDDTTPAATPMKANNMLQEPEPPTSTSKTEYSAGDISGSSSEMSRPADDAPLPPDFLTTKSAEPESQPPLPDESEEGEESDDFDESGEDVTKEISPTEDQSQSLKFSPESSFGTTDRTPLGGSFTKVSQPNDPSKPKPLFGEVGSGSIPMLPPPSKMQQSPRSPSPVRSAIPPMMLRPESSRSVSAPTRSGSAIQKRIEKLGKSPLATEPTPEEKRTAELEQQRIAQEQSRKQAENGNLTDDEDERLREELLADIVATRNLDDFLYHEDYTKKASKSGIPGQIELLYRDINSMIDTLGINSRSLESWMKWQTENYTEVGEVDASRLDIEEEDWCLDQVEEIPAIVDKISEDLEAGRLHDMRSKVKDCHELVQSCSKLDKIALAIRKNLEARKDLTLLSTPLSAEQASIQHDLRKASKKVQTLLVEVEQSTFVLRAQLSSVNTANGAKPGSKRPTVDAVTTTIQKMTGMAEKRSVDIDLLESQLRKLDLVPNGETSLVRGSPSPSSSREESPFRTPPPQGQANGKRRSVRNAPSSTASPGNTSLYYTPDSTPGKSGGFKTSTRSTRASGANFRSSVDRQGTPSRRLEREASSWEKSRYTEKLRRRKEVLGIVKEALGTETRGVRASVEGR